MSTEPFRTVFWVVLDGAGSEQVKRCAATGRFPALSRIAREGILGAAAPSSPVCQTPPALLTLFTGLEPREHGVWGYQQPDFARDPFRTVSGFSVAPRAGRTIWEDLDSRGIGASVMNVAFRKDPVWSGRLPHVELAYDAYRLSRRGAVFAVPRGASTHRFLGIDFAAVRGSDGVSLRKGSRTVAHLTPGGVAPVRLTPGSRASAHLFGEDRLLLHPETPAVMRLADPALTTGFEWSVDMNAFKSGRRLRERARGGPPLEDELAPCRESMRRKADLMLWAVRNLPSRLFVCYIPLIDEYNHAYMDLLEDDWAGRGNHAGSEVLFGCMGLVDDFLARLMEAAGEDTLLLVSSDHGSMPVRRKLLLNEVLADAGLVARGPGGYVLRKSLAYYHPSDCGQVLLNPVEARRLGVDRPVARRRVLNVLERANRAHGSGVGWVEGQEEDPYLLFLYPTSDTTLTGDPPGASENGLLRRKTGGHHLSPLSPSPWMAAVFAAWSRRRLAALPRAPDANAGLKGFVLGCLGAA